MDAPAFAHAGSDRLHVFDHSGCLFDRTWNGQRFWVTHCPSDQTATSGPRAMPDTFGSGHCMGRLHAREFHAVLACGSVDVYEPRVQFSDRYHEIDVDDFSGNILVGNIISARSGSCRVARARCRRAFRRDLCIQYSRRNRWCNPIQHGVDPLGGDTKFPANSDCPLRHCCIDPFYSVAPAVAARLGVVSDVGCACHRPDLDRLGNPMAGGCVWASRRLDTSRLPVVPCGSRDSRNADSVSG